MGVSPAREPTGAQSLTGLILGGRRSQVMSPCPYRDGTDLHWVSTGTAESLVLLVSLCFFQDKTGPSGVDSGAGLG